MPSAYVIRNQLGQYLTRKGEWVSGKDASVLFHQPWFDQALNHLIEINSKDIELRARVEELELDDKARPLVLETGPDTRQGELLEEKSSAQMAMPAAGETPVADQAPAADTAPAADETPPSDSEAAA